MHEKQIYQTKTISELTIVYKAAIEKIEKAYLELAVVRDDLRLAFAGDRMEVCLTDRKHGEYKPRSVKDFVIAELRREAWRYVYDKLGIRKILSVKRMKEFDKIFYYHNDFDKDVLPEFTVENVFDMFQGFMNSADDFLREAVEEVYQLLRPASRLNGNWQKLKTNEKNGKYAVGKKIIIRVLTTESYWPGRVSNYWENEVVAIDRVFHSLDGKGAMDGYKSELVDAINTCENYGETQYFKFRACKNGNLHLEFKRLDLLQNLNRIAGCETELQG